jgi:streptogramin lyase
MLAVQGERVWYTAQTPFSLGTLDPLAASWTEFEPEQGTGSLIEYKCEEDIEYTTGGVPISTGTLTWTSQKYSTLMDDSGWQIYQLPADASPWGITATNAVWFVDNARNVLVKIPTVSQVFLPFIVR